MKLVCRDRSRISYRGLRKLSLGESVVEALDEAGRNTPVSCDNNSRHREDDFTNSKKIHRAGSVANAFRLRSELQKIDSVAIASECRPQY